MHVRTPGDGHIRLEPYPSGIIWDSSGVSWSRKGAELSLALSASPDGRFSIEERSSFPGGDEVLRGISKGDFNKCIFYGGRSTQRRFGTSPLSADRMFELVFPPGVLL